MANTSNNGTYMGETYLKPAGIPYTMRSEKHLVVEGKDGFIDYWPTTGTWIPRTPPKTKGFGVNNLIKFIKE